MSRVAVFLPSMRGGGAERAMLRIAGGMAADGLETDLVLARAEGPYLTAVPDGVRVVDLGRRHVLAALPGLVRYLRRRRPDGLIAAIVHANVAAVWARRLAGLDCRLALSVQNNLSESLRTVPLRARALPWLIRRTYPAAEAITAVSRGVAEDLVAHFGCPAEQVRVIYNPIVTPEMLAAAEQSAPHPWAARAPGRAGAGEDAIPLLVTVGRLSYQKNFPLLLHAFAALRRKRPARLLILGEGEDRASLERLIGELGLGADVALPGFVDNPHAFMAAASLFVLSSHFEGLPTVLVEALAAGCPVVSVDCPSGPREILADGRYGPLTPPGDAAALTEAIERTLEAPPESATLKARADDFRIERSVEGFRRALGL